MRGRPAPRPSRLWRPVRSWPLRRRNDTRAGGSYPDPMRDWLARSGTRAPRPRRRSRRTTSGSRYAELDARGGRAGASPAGSSRARRVGPRATPGVGLAVLLHALPRRGARARAATRGGAPAEAAARSAPPRTRSVRREHPTRCGRTRSSTPRAPPGSPSRVELSIANHAASAPAAAADAVGVEPDDRWLCPLPLHHVGGLTVLVRCRDQRHDRRPPRPLRRRAGRASARGAAR